MKVTHIVRIDAGLYYGGGEIQAERTADALSRLGIEVMPFDCRQKHLGDIVHFFGNFDYFEDVAGHCRRQGVPYVVSPIFVTPRTPTRLKVRAARQRALGQYQSRSLRLLQGASALLTLTPHEEDSLRAYFGTDLPPMIRVPNGVEQRFAEGDPSRFRDRYGIEGRFAIHIGTIDRSKNQLASIAACKGICPLVILGRTSDVEYERKCRAVSGDTVHFLGALPHHDPMLSDALASADVFILPSYRELFPLSALEATVAGCSLVLSDRWAGQDIWAADARFVNPDSEADLRQAVQQALDEGRPSRARSLAYLDRYSWEAVAKMIAEVYRTTRV